MTRRVVEFPLGWAEQYGTGTLIGALMADDGSTTLADVTEVELVFHETTLNFKRYNNGPHLSLMPEHFPICFAEDLLGLVNRGVTIHISKKLVVV